jgi:hypothetical protein
MHEHFEGRLTTRDAKSHILHHFEVPADVRALELIFRFTPVLVSGYKNLLTLTLFDARGESAAGFRGAGHRDGEAGHRDGEAGHRDGEAGVDQDTSVHHVRLSETTATPGYLPGPLPAGTWTVEIDTHMIMPGPHVTYTLDVTTMETADRPPAEKPQAGHEPDSEPRGPGWYRGDLHTHSAHSDAHGFSVPELARAAAEARLDFVFLTDHNTISGLAEWPPTSPVLLGAGLELTTYWGHAVCLGTRDWVDWRVTPGATLAGAGMSGIAAELEMAGGIFVIAHPGSVGDPACTGCAWRFGEMMPAGASFVEVWNGPWAGDSGNEAALSLWYDWLNQGHHLTATAGTDAHGLGAYAPDGTEGLPGFTVVGAAACTERALLNGLSQGCCYLSAGPRLDFTALDAAGVRYDVGAQITAPATLTLSWNAVPPGAQGRLLANGRLLDAWPCAEEGERSWRISAETADWLVVEIRDAGGWMLALTNPFYVRG